MMILRLFVALRGSLHVLRPLEALADRADGGSWEAQLAGVRALGWRGGAMRGVARRSVAWRGAARRGVVQHGAAWCSLV